MQRVALVTGGMGGLGGHLHQAGGAGLQRWSPPIRRQQEGKDWLASMNNMGYGFKAYPCDVADFDRRARNASRR